MKRIAVLFILSAALTAACTSAQWVRTTVAKGYEFNVTLEQREEKGEVTPQGYDHPHKVEASDLATLLEGLNYGEKRGLTGSEEQSRVFQTVEIDRLAPALAEALAKADAGQRIRFTSFNQGKTLIFSVPRKTEGVIFIEPAGRLNVAFNFINAKRQPSEATAIAPTYASVDPLKIKTAETTLLATAPYAQLHTFADGEQAPMWVDVDLEKLQKSPRAAAAPVVEPSTAAPPAVAPKGVTDAAPVEKAAPTPAPDDTLKAEIKNKLRYIKELLDEGLISETDYTDKKRELLDKIK